jgi:hypothetical protein
LKPKIARCQTGAVGSTTAPANSIQIRFCFRPVRGRMLDMTRAGDHALQGGLFAPAGGQQ